MSWLISWRLPGQKLSPSIVLQQEKFGVGFFCGREMIFTGLCEPTILFVVADLNLEEGHMAWIKYWLTSRYFHSIQVGLGLIRDLLHSRFLHLLRLGVCILKLLLHDEIRNETINTGLNPTLCIVQNDEAPNWTSRKCTESWVSGIRFKYCMFEKTL